MQFVWDAIALHTTISLAWHKEPRVVSISYGISTDFSGVQGASMDLLPQEEYDAVVEEVPRLGMKNAFKEVMCGLCRTNPKQRTTTSAPSGVKSTSKGTQCWVTAQSIDWSLVLRDWDDARDFWGALAEHDHQRFFSNAADFPTESKSAPDIG